MNFSDALTELKNGKALHRVGWNGRGLKVKVQHPDDNSKMGNRYTYIDATALGGTLNPWQPSQTDLFADDWQILEEKEEETK